ncbi:TFIIH/NER complex subunit [Mycoemilia scoparia]|uniref:RNA polymerase II transcription factor B subunit 3 n=1 Tax=Mycoemilia scoparia TaxID=417184 RepID=A0A9W7ZY71_9FUNG|nr:TFIIH/NER complex subunit [Mycoemilia scoparia]
MASLTAGTNQDIPAYDSEELCPVCQSNRYLNPDMKFLVSSCHHRLCEDCVERIFGSGPAKCPVCQLVIRKGSFYRQLFEDLTVEKEIRVRKRVARTFNKRQNEFKTLRDYNDYLEFIEDLVFNLTYDVNIQETEGIIEEHEKKNRETITKNNSLIEREKMLTQLQLEQEQRNKAVNRKTYLEGLRKEEQAKKSAKSSFINELATSNKDATEIEKKMKEKAEKEKLLNKKISHQQGSSQYGGVGGRGLGSRLSQLHQGLSNGMDVDSDGLMAIDEEQADLERYPEFFDPMYSPYKPISGVNIKPQYQDRYYRAKALKDPVLTVGGYTQNIHSKYLLEAAMSGMLVLPIKESND